MLEDTEKVIYLVDMVCLIELRKVVKRHEKIQKYQKLAFVKKIQSEDHPSNYPLTRR